MSNNALWNHILMNNNSQEWLFTFQFWNYWTCNICVGPSRKLKKPPDKFKMIISRVFQHKSLTYFPPQIQLKVIASKLLKQLLGANWDVAKKLRWIWKCSCSSGFFLFKPSFIVIVINQKSRCSLMLLPTASQRDSRGFESELWGFRNLCNKIKINQLTRIHCWTLYN